MIVFVVLMLNETARACIFPVLKRCESCSYPNCGSDI